MEHEPWTAERVLQGLRRQPLLGGSVVAFLLLCALSTVVGTAMGVANFRDVEYPDSADLLRIGDVIRSGQIYPDGDLPPYMVSLYGPLTYLLLSIPYRLAQAAGITPQVLVRVGVLGAVCLCVWFIYLISRRLYSSRPIAWLCVLFAVSALPLAEWATMVRGDFLGLAFSLASIYWFLLRNGRPQTVGAAICAGLASLVKQTFFAAPIAIIGWLIYRRRYKEAAVWAAGVALTVAGGYTLVWLHEPLMLKTIAVLRHPVLEYPHALGTLFDALSEVVVPFAAIGAFVVVRNRAPERLLFLFYCVAAWLLAMFTIPQVGGAINYFWEPFFASAVLAGPGLWELQRKANRTPVLGTVILFVLLGWSLLPIVRERLGYLSRCYTNVRQYQVRKARWESFVSTVSGRRLLSTSPDVTVLSSIPEIPDPFLNATLERRSGWNSDPIAAQIDAGVYDLIVIKDGEAEKHQDDYRGIRRWSDGMWGALNRTYGAACVLMDDKYVEKSANEGGEEIWLPRRGAGEILPRLLAIGCVPAAKQVDSGPAVGTHSP
jgi:Dolichyl-phosphate-mannose-protein mannosyltransferase